jgi:REP element-mobilizing transposase RayT
MSTRRPIFAAGNYYHLYNRGAHRECIFRSDENYLFVLRRIKKVLRDCPLTLIAYSLLPNHYHFLIRQDGDTPAGFLPQNVFNSYSKAYNKRYQHSGTLFEGPYKAIYVERRAHLLHLCRYIHANPVTHGLVRRVEEWPYSNYLEWVGERDGTLVDREFVRDCFGAADDYRQYVWEYILFRQHPPDLRNIFDDLDI